MRVISMMPNCNAFVNDQLNRLQRDLESAFTGSTAPGHPALNLWEDDNIFIDSELPGYQQNELEAYIVGNDQLVLKGERKHIKYEKAINHRQERSFGSFERNLTLPAPVDGDKIEAKFTNGVLQLKLAKSEIAKPKKIDITIN